MNNKGQTLVIFVILLPILLMFLSYIVDLGVMHFDKKNIVNNVKYALSHYLDNYENDNIYNDTYEYLNKNIKNGEISIEYTDDYIIIEVIKKREKVYSIFKNNCVIDITYKGDVKTKRITRG